jgi:hypothetical protein
MMSNTLINKEILACMGLIQFGVRSEGDRGKSSKGRGVENMAQRA